MYKESKDKSKKVKLTISVIATILVMSAMSMAITPNATALDLDNFSIDDLGQSAECVIVVVGCDGTGSVGSSGDTIIGSFNGNDDNNTNGGEPGTLTVFKEVECAANGGTPSETAVCAFALQSANFPDPSDYPITVSGNGPNPASFDGDDAGTPVSIGEGNYAITEELADTGPLQAQLQGPNTSIITTTTANGDCTPVFGPNNNFLSAEGSMTSGGSQECTLINTVTINNGVVPD